MTGYEGITKQLSEHEAFNLRLEDRRGYEAQNVNALDNEEWRREMVRELMTPYRTFYQNLLRSQAAKDPKFQEVRQNPSYNPYAIGTYSTPYQQSALRADFDKKDPGLKLHEVFSLMHVPHSQNEEENTIAVTTLSWDYDSAPYFACIKIHNSQALRHHAYPGITKFLNGQYQKAVNPAHFISEGLDPATRHDPREIWFKNLSSSPYINLVFPDRPLPRSPFPQVSIHYEATDAEFIDTFIDFLALMPTEDIK